MSQDLNSASLSFIDFVEDSLLDAEHSIEPTQVLAPEFSRVIERPGTAGNPIDLTNDDDDVNMRELVDGAITDALMKRQITQSDAADIDLFLTQPNSSPIRVTDRWGDEYAHRENGAKKLAFPANYSKTTWSFILWYPWTEDVSLIKQFNKALFDWYNNRQWVVNVAIGLEKCPTTDRLHSHCIVKFNRGRLYNLLLHPGKNEKNKDGTPVREFCFQELPLELHDINYVKQQNYKSAVEYVHKERTKYDENSIWTSFELKEPKPLSKEETYFRQNMKTIIHGNVNELDPYFVFRHASKIQKIREIFNKPEKREFKPKGIFIWGAPGLGKTSIIKRWFKKQYWTEKPKSQDWFTPWNGEPIILLDEIDPEYVLKYGTSMNQWADGYDTVVPIKGGFTTISHDFFVMISNYSPQQLWGTSGDMEGNNPFKQMQRRLITKEFHKISEEFDCNNKQHVLTFIKLLFGERYDEIVPYLEEDLFK